MRLRERLFRFFYGRYGLDQLNYAILGLYFILAVISMFTRSYIISILMTVLLVIAFVRMLSRNIYKRRNENQVFLKIWNNIKSWFLLQRDRIRDRKTHVYRKCNNCKAIIRLPKKKGHHTVTCPKCRNRFNVNI